MRKDKSNNYYENFAKLIYRQVEELINNKKQLAELPNPDERKEVKIEIDANDTQKQ